jgi:hypothetical protein
VITLKGRIPAPTSTLLTNLLGVLGMLGAAAAVGGLTHNVWWAVLVASVEVVAVSVIASLNLDDTLAADELAALKASRSRAV